MNTSEKPPKRPMFEQRPRERTPEEQAILSGAVPPSTATTGGSLTPIEEAGVRLARAMQRREECARYVAQTRKLVAEAEAELHAADIALADARTHLAELVEGRRD